MRAREFIMKDAYSFDLDEAGSRRSYEAMRDAYRRIFARTGLDFRVVEADSGAIGGSRSEEFHVLAESGEDDIAFNDAGTYAANLELTPAPPPPAREPAAETMREVSTPDVRTISEVSAGSGCRPSGVSRPSSWRATTGRWRSSSAATMTSTWSRRAASTGCGLRSLWRRRMRCARRPAPAPERSGRWGSACRWWSTAGPLPPGTSSAGRTATTPTSQGVNWGRDAPEPATADLRNAIEGDPSPDGRGAISIRRGIEVGHVFQLGRKYSESMHAVCLDESGRARTLEMGCYGIGVSRIAAAAIEQSHDENGIVWPDAIAPFEVALLPVNAHRSGRVRDRSEALYEALRAAGIEVLLDDRAIRPGVMFSEMDLIGIPHRLVLGERRLDEGAIEYRRRRGGETEIVPLEEAVAHVAARLDRRSGEG